MTTQHKTQDAARLRRMIDGARKERHGLRARLEQVEGFARWEELGHFIRVAEDLLHEEGGGGGASATPAAGGGGTAARTARRDPRPRGNGAADPRSTPAEVDEAPRPGDAMLAESYGHRADRAKGELWEAVAQKVGWTRRPARLAKRVKRWAEANGLPWPPSREAGHSPAPPAPAPHTEDAAEVERARAYILRVYRSHDMTWQDVKEELQRSGTVKSLQQDVHRFTRRHRIEWPPCREGCEAAARAGGRTVEELLAARPPEGAAEEEDQGEDADEAQWSPPDRIPAGGLGREKSCSRCGRSFRTTPTRRMLCEGCYRAADGGLDVHPLHM